MEQPKLTRREKITAVSAFVGVCVLAGAAGILANRALFGNDEPSRLPVPEEPPPVESLPPETIPEPSAQPEDGFGKEVPLKNGSLARGGLMISNLLGTQGIGIDCIESYKPETGESPKSREVWLPVNLNTGFSPSRAFAPNIKSVIYVGEETEEPALGFVALSNGWALEYDPLADQYTAYTFEVKETQDRRDFVEALPESLQKELQRGTAIGTPVRIISHEEMRQGISLSDATKQLDVRLQTITPPSAARVGKDGPLRLVVRCNDETQASEQGGLG